MPGLEQSKPLRKMGLHSSPTGELFLQDVEGADADRLLGGSEEKSKGREGAKDTFSMERARASPRWPYGIIDRCLELSDQVREGARAVRASRSGSIQLIQEKLAKHGRRAA